MLPDRVSNPGPLTYKSGALPIALRGPANLDAIMVINDSGQRANDDDGTYTSNFFRIDSQFWAI